ncbi:MAG TPA: xanthine dehydrogenase family protein molybdopterin-binding subunit [Actinomycetota bacterium]|nr:xanthine dehydrogenase family protein molybdopterin-binding subunit [Actinomycetota bacterium]
MPEPRRVRRGAVLRREDRGLLTGATPYLEDVPVAGAVHAVFVRSGVSHARITSIDAAEARAMPDVVGVFTTEDLAGLRMPAVENMPDGLRRPLLAAGVVRFVGEPVAVVIATTRRQALDAAEVVAVEYDPLPVVVDPVAAMAPGAPLLFPDEGSNVALVLRCSTHDDVLEGAHVVARGTFLNQRVAPVPLEVNGAIAVPEGDRLTLWLSCQATHYSRTSIARAIGFDEDRLRVRTAAVGGGFGAKIPAYAEQAVVAALALRLARPVRYTESRSENILAMTHGRDQLQDIEIGATREGRIVGLRARVVADLGAYADEGATLPESTAMMAVGPYDIRRVDLEIRAVLTNKTPLGAYRGAGRPEATALLERAIDLLAVELGIDPAEVRRRNFIREFPHETVAGARYDVGDYERTLQEALRRCDYAALRAEQAERRRRGDRVLLGIGIASYVEVTGWGSEYARVAVDTEGRVVLVTGASPQGQGHETAFAQLVADRLAVPFEAVGVRHSDTDVVPRSEGTMGSRTLQVAGSAVLGAADALVERARSVAARLLEAAPEDVVLSDDGRFEVAGVPGSGPTWAEIARVEPLDAEHDFETPDSTYPFGTHVAVVEVDAETGEARLLRHVAVDDCGTVLNPMLVEGQVHGGIGQGAAQALFEGVTYDEFGTPMTGNLSTYAFPSAAELPSFETASTETPTPMNPLGAKGIGEAGTIGSIPAVQNAVVDALAHLGVRHLNMPAAPERVWRAIADARSATGAGGDDGTPRAEGPDRGDRDADERGLLDRRELAPPIREMARGPASDGSGGERGHGGGAPPLR